MAPKREENTPVKLVKEAFQDPGKAEVQVPGQLTGPVSASASYWSASTPAPPYVQRLHDWIYTLYDQQSK